MKGIIIWEDNGRATYCELINNAHSELTQYAPKTIISSLKGETSKLSKTVCSKDDTYDFETGALIALMKMCGVEKVVRACNEAFSEDTFKTYATKYERELNELKKDFDKVRDLKDFYKKNYEDVKEHYGKLGDRNKYLMEDINKKLGYLKEKDEEIKRLKGESESHWKKYQRNIQKKQDRINELNNIEEEYIKLREEYDSLFEENEKLQHEYNLCKNSENALKCSVDYLNKTIAKLNAAIHGYKEDLNKVAERCEELEIKESTLNKQEETINKREEKMSVYFGGRGNGKQYKALVELFKKLPQDKVDAAYKEAYNTTLPVWQKEVLNQMYVVYKESKEKPVQIKGFNINIKPSTKRAEMWNDILACDCEHSKYVKVKKEVLETFAKECNEKKIFNVIGYEFHTQEFWFADDSCIFQIFRKPAGFICAKSVGFVFKDTVIDYLPPMRWDLFKKGRLIVKVNSDNYEDFYNKCEEEIGRKPFDKYTGSFTVYYKYEKELEQYIFHTRPYKDIIPYAKKIVNWGGCKMIPDIHIEKDDKEILKQEYCEAADKIRKTMVLMSYYKYGPARKNFKEGRVDAFKSAEECMQAFKKDKNTEHLLDAMNYLMFRYMYPLPGEHYKATDSDGSVKPVGTPINMEDPYDSWKW